MPETRPVKVDTLVELDDTLPFDSKYPLNPVKAQCLTKSTAS